MSPLYLLVSLTLSMARTCGSPEVIIGLIDANLIG
jgi:hypothetical protein